MLPRSEFDGLPERTDAGGSVKLEGVEVEVEMVVELVKDEGDDGACGACIRVQEWAGHNKDGEE